MLSICMYTPNNDVLNKFIFVKGVPEYFEPYKGEGVFEFF